MDNDNHSWQSGVRFAEVKKPKKFAKSMGILLLAFLSASIGGLFGGYYVKKNYDTSFYGGYKGQTDIESNAKSKNILSKTPTSADLPKNSITKVAEGVGPAIVGINSNDTTWEDGDALSGSGSGIIFDSKGYIVTNEHIIDGASHISVTLSGGRKLMARLIGKDTRTDLAVLKVEASKLPIAKFGNSGNCRVGDVGVAIGNPLGEEFSGSVTVGVISAVNKKLQVDGSEYRILQTDASINSGNTGGALCNEAGEVVGISNYRMSDTDGIGYAIAINEARPVIESIIKNGYVKRASLGVKSKFVDKEDAEFYSVPMGDYVQELYFSEDSPDLGLKVGDIIINFDNKNVTTEDELLNRVQKHKIGDIVKARVWRGKKIVNVRIRLVDSYGQ